MSHMLSTWCINCLLFLSYCYFKHTRLARKITWSSLLINCCHECFYVVVVVPYASLVIILIIIADLPSTGSSTPSSLLSWGAWWSGTSLGRDYLYIEPNSSVNGNWNCNHNYGSDERWHKWYQHNWLGTAWFIHYACIIVNYLITAITLIISLNKLTRNCWIWGSNPSLVCFSLDH